MLQIIFGKIQQVKHARVKSKQFSATLSFSLPAYGEIWLRARNGQEYSVQASSST